MRFVLLAVLAIAACTSSEPAPPPSSEAAQLDALKAPRPSGTEVIAGTVAKREGGALFLDSGGAKPILLQYDDSTHVTVDGQPGNAADIREGDLVRAAYTYDRTGDPLALRVVANTHPPRSSEPAQQK